MYNYLKIKVYLKTEGQRDRHMHATYIYRDRGWSLECPGFESQLWPFLILWPLHPLDSQFPYLKWK